MIRKHSVRLKILASCDISTKRPYNLFSEKTACSIACIDHDLKPFKWVIIVLCLNSVTDDISQVSAVTIYDINILPDCFFFSPGCFELFC